FVLRGDDCLTRLLAEFFKYFVETLIEEIRSVRALGPLLFSRLDEAIQTIKHLGKIRIGKRDLSPPLFLELIVETRYFPGMTSRAFGLDRHKQRVTITIQTRFDDALSISRTLALMP